MSFTCLTSSSRSREHVAFFPAHRSIKIACRVDEEALMNQEEEFCGKRSKLIGMVGMIPPRQRVMSLPRTMTRKSLLSPLVSNFPPFSTP